MPYTCKLEGSKWSLQKKDGSKSFGNHDTKKACMAQMKALYASEMSKAENIVIEGFVQMPYDIDYKIANSGERINLVIDTEGGSFIEGMMIHNKLKASGKPVDVYIRAFAFSAGAILALSGDNVYMAENGLMMIHAPALQSEYAKTAKELEGAAEALRAYEGILVNTLMAKTKRDEAYCRKMMENETWLTAKEAMDLGLVTDIIPILRNVEVRNFMPERIINFVREKDTMPLKDICQKFGISATDEDAEEKLTNYIQTLQPPRKTKLSEGVLNMVRKARETELNFLVQEGKVVAAVATDLKTKFLSDDRITADAENDSDEFDSIINALKKNEQVISFKEKTGSQTITDPNKNGGGSGDNVDDNYLANLMAKKNGGKK